MQIYSSSTPLGSEREKKVCFSGKELKNRFIFSLFPHFFCFVLFFRFWPEREPIGEAFSPGLAKTARGLRQRSLATFFSVSRKAKTFFWPFFILRLKVALKTNTHAFPEKIGVEAIFSGLFSPCCDMKTLCLQNVRIDVNKSSVRAGREVTNKSFSVGTVRKENTSGLLFFFPITLWSFLTLWHQQCLAFLAFGSFSSRLKAK